MNDTIVTIVGAAVSDVRATTTKDGVAVTDFRLASTERRRERATGVWIDVATSYYKVTCWRLLAQHVAASVHRGDPVVVYGKQRVVPWQSGDRSGTSVEIEAFTVGPDLTRGTSTFARYSRTRSFDEAPAAVSPDEPSHDDMRVAAAGANADGELTAGDDADGQDGDRVCVDGLGVVDPLTGELVSQREPELV